MKAVVLLYLILHCALPLISGKTSSGGNSVEVTKDGERNFPSKSNSLRDSIPNTDVKGSDGEDDILENWKLDPSQATPPKLFTAYKETYITKAAAKKFLQKIRTLKKPYTEKEYDDLLQEIMLEPKPTSKYSIYDKKYFDYLPSDHMDVKSDLSKADQDTTQHRHTRHHGRHHQRRERSKRHTEGEEKKLKKRQTDVEWTRHFLENERRYHEQLRREFEEEANQRFSQHIQPVVYTNQIYSVPVSAEPNNPWNNPFYRPRLNNYYLPPDPNQIVVRPQQTFISYPIPGVVYNPPFPPQNPPVTQVTQPPTTSPTSPPDSSDMQPGVMSVSRFGEDEDRPVWDVVDKPSRFIPEMPSESFAPATTRRPTPPVIRDNDDYYDDLTASNKISQGDVNQVRATTRRPPPPLIHNSEDYDDLPGNSGSAQRPPSRQPNFNQVGSGSPGAQQRPNQPEAPPPVPMRPLQSEGPSRCVWAIVNCCSPRNPAVRYACFERVGCHGVFWDLNPCSDIIVQAAVDETNRYFT